MIRLEGVTKVFPGTPRPAVEDLTLTVSRGETMVLVGPSGCGKTTTLKMINRIIEPTAGQIWVDGRLVSDVEAHLLRRSIGYVIQQVGLFPHRTVAENIATVPSLLAWEEGRIRDRVAELIDLVGLAPELANRYPAELSGGQQQRVGVARALAADPPVLLMDEPFGAVDPIVRARLQDELAALQERLHKTIVFVTHDIDEAIKLGDRIAILNVGGKLEQLATPEEILKEPANAFVEDFLGGERGLKRLGLLEVGDAPLDRGPTVDLSDPAAAALRVAADRGVDWVVVLAGDRLCGWLPVEEVERAARVGDLVPRPFLVNLRREDSLRDALDAVVTSRARVAVVLDRDDRYLGLLDLEAIAEEITE